MLHRLGACKAVGSLILWIHTAGAQNLGIPGAWPNTTSTLSRSSRADLASNAAAALLSRVTPNGTSDALPYLQYSTSTLAALSLQDYYSGNSSWYHAVSTNIQENNQRWGLYGAYVEEDTLNSDAIYWGLAFFYAYRAYKQQNFLDLATMAHNMTYTSGFITTSDAGNGTGAGRNITFTPPPGCTNATIAGCVFWKKGAQDNTQINSETVSPFMALSAYLYEETGSSFYKQVAQQSLDFIIHYLWNGSVVYDTIELSDCKINSTPNSTLTYNQAWFIEGLSVWANVTQDRAMKALLETAVISVTTVRSWNSEIGVINEGLDNDNIESTLKGIFIRGLTEARLRNPNTALSQYIEAYITNQYNSLLENALTPGTDFYTTSWIGPPDPNFSPAGNIAALDVLNAAVLFATPNAPGPTTSSTESSATGSSVASPTDSHSATHNKSSNVGGIAGGVVAGIVVAFAAGAAYIIWRRRRKHVMVIDAVLEQPGSDKPVANGDSSASTAIEPFVHPGPAPLARSKLQRMNAPPQPDHVNSAKSSVGRAPSLIDQAESMPMLTSDGDEGNNPRARMGFEHAGAAVQSRTESGSFNRSSMRGSVVADNTVASAPRENHAQEVRAEQTLMIADLPTLARHLYPLLQDQQAEHPPQYGL
ncbi:hypothetical protein PENSPDRAFT_747116 [Peniophora sp. CONT]|nr:hypothetical protein PENSPDRAFT_747116 [Peniophora sp. CONT]